MNNKMNKIIKLFMLAVFAFSVFNFSACDDVEEVTLDTGLQQISITRQPDKLTYTRADRKLDITGLIVTATFRSGSSKVIPNDQLTFSGFRSTEGYYTSSEVITVTYENSQGVIRQTQFQIKYSDLTGISITAPDKTRYTQNEPLNLNGLVVYANYADNSSQPVFTASVLEALRLVKLGNNETMISEDEYYMVKNYRGRDEYNNVSSLIIPLEYELDDDDNFILDEEGNRKLVKMIEFYGFDDTSSAITESSQVVTVKYTEIADDYFALEKAAQFQVKIAKLTGLSVAVTPDKTYYTANNVLSFDGINLKAGYSDGSSETVFSKEIYNNLTTITDRKKAEIESFIGGTGKALSIPLEWKTDNYGNIIYSDGAPVAAREIIFSDFDSTNGATQQNVYVKYKDNWGDSEQISQTQFTIIYDKLQGISIASEPSKDKYKRGEFLDFKGLVVKAQYSYGKTEIIFSEKIFENLSTLTPLERMAVYSYTGADGEDLIIPLEWKRDSDGNIVQKDGKNVALRELKIKGFDSTKIISSEQVTITLTDNSGDDSVPWPSKFVVTFVDMAGIQLSTNPVKLKYIKNEPLDLGGLVLNAQYEDNSLETVFSDTIFASLTTLSAEQKALVKKFTGAASVGRNWYEQLETSLDSNATLTIPLEWKKNYAGDYVDKDGNKIDASSDQKVCVRGITVLGFNSTQDTGNQTVRLRFIDKTGYGVLEKEVSFGVTYRNLRGIQLTGLPADAVVGTAQNSPIDFSGITVIASYSDGTYETVFSKAILDSLPAGYISADVTTYTGASGKALTISLQKNSSNEDIRKIVFSGYNSTLSQTQQTVTVTYFEGETSFYTQYGVKYNGLRAISVKSNAAGKYKMNATATDANTAGGIGTTGSNRNGFYQTLDDIKNWHFNADGLKLGITYNDGSEKTLTFTNSNSDYCYGTAYFAYVYEGEKLSYMQRWSNEKDSNDNQYKIKITGFDPVSVFTTTEDLGGSQILTIYYTEDGVTVSTQIQINYDFTASYKKTENLQKIDGNIQAVLLGDYPQTKKAESVQINKYKQQNGLYNYQVGSDGNLYCQKTWTEKNAFYKVEPIKWIRINTSEYSSGYYYRSEKVLDNGISYYAGRSDRKNSKQESFTFSSQNRRCSGNVTYNYYIGDYSFNYSTLRNWLTGESVNGDNTYNNKGFLQTAFTSTVIEEKLKPMELCEYYDADVVVSGSVPENDKYEISRNITAAATGLTFKEKFSVKATVPSDYYDHPIQRKFFNDAETVDGEMATRISSNAKTETWNSAVYGDFAPFKGIAYDITDKTDFITSATIFYWVATDVRTSRFGNPGRADIDGTGETSHHGIASGTNVYYGVTPVILLGNIE